MLYSNTSAGYPMLCNALEGLGVSASALDAFVSFMDSESGSDASALEGIDKIDLHGGLDWKKLDALEKAIKKELIQSSDNDAQLKYYYFCYKVGGSMCWRIMRSNTYSVSERDKSYSLLKNAFGLYLEEKSLAPAAAFGVRLAEISCQNGSYHIPHDRNADLCLDAEKFIDRDMLAARALAISYALDSLNKGETGVDTALEALRALISDIHSAGIEPRYAGSYLLALSEGAYFDEALKADLESLGVLLDDKTRSINFIGAALGLNVDSKRVFEVFESVEVFICPDYIFYIKSDKHKQALALRFNDVYIEAIKQCRQLLKAIDLEKNIIASGAPYDKQAVDIQGSAKVRVAAELAKQFKAPDLIEKYIFGEASFEDARGAILDGKLTHTSMGAELNYYTAFGRDDFAARCVTAAMTAPTDFGKNYRIGEYTGFDIAKEESIIPAYEMMTKGGADFTLIIKTLADCIDDMYGAKEKCFNKIVELLDTHRQDMLSLDLKKIGATGRLIYTKAVCRHPNEYKAQILALCDDGSKAVKAEVAEVIAGHKDWSDDVKALLTAKKAGRRELAADIIAKQGAAEYQADLAKAFEAEKSEKLKAKIGALIGAKIEGKAAKEVSLEETIAKLAKSAKSSKLGFLFEKEFAPVKKKDGSQADESLLQALVMSYASFTAPARSAAADSIASLLDEGDLEKYAAEIFGRWYDNGAQAKQKSVLYFCAVHGGVPMVRDLMHYIKEWGENMRGAIAAEAVKAMALGGSSEALMNIDNMSRKFKNKQVRSAAGEALANAAEQLGITTQELADRIVPDLGFDERRCRVFDFGPRQFEVYLAPDLTLEIFFGEKKMKNLPKAGANDDAAKAEAAIKDFKEMKKLLKSTVDAQKQRLEYVMMCERKWTKESFDALFVKNAVMHCFAIGLIWGVYEGDTLKATFRYMDDGSFTTADEDEYTLPENAQIGLVHPTELTTDEIAKWKEQLEDYEITQPFDQLSRKVYLPTEEEKKAKRLPRFKGRELNSITLVNKMTKLGWYKGTAEDAGYFYYFYRDDITSRERAQDGSTVLHGSSAMLTFGGASVVIYDFEGEDTDIQDLIFYKPAAQPYYYDKEQKGFLKIGEISTRYFSEIVRQLSEVFPEKEEEG